MKTFDKYDILEEIGKGGFATVYRARDRDLDREVALKVLDPLLMRDPVWVKRFKREARAVAQFKHPHIVSIYEIGQAEGVLYIAMELAQGGNLDARIQRLGRLSWEETLRLVGEMASALDYAHGKGVLHRDLKPANVLLDPETGSVLTDFGFVRILADNSMSVSLSGGVVGTPAYIAPEVWKGQNATAQTDLYALGCILYEMLMGEKRFTGQTSPAVMMAHFKPPPLPTDWPEDVPPGVNEVLERAMAPEPEERYASAGELVEDLAALALDRLAEPYAALEEAVAAGQWQQALALADEIKGVDADYRDVAGLEQRALAGLAEAAKQEQAAQWQEAAEQALAAGDLDAAELAIGQWLTLLPGNERALAMKKRVEELRSGEEAESPGDDVAGEEAETRAPEPDSQSGGGPGWKLWAALAGVAALVMIIFFSFGRGGGQPTPEVIIVTATPTAQLVAANATSPSTPAATGLAAKTPTHTPTGTTTKITSSLYPYEQLRLGRGRLSQVAFSPQSHVLAVASSTGIWLYSLEQDQIALSRFIPSNTWIMSVAWSPDGAHLASWSKDGTVGIWDMASGELLRTMEGHSNFGWSAAWSPDGTRLASGWDDKTVRIWDAASGKLLRTLEGHSGFVFSVAWSPDGTHLASGSDDKTVGIWDAASGELLRTLEGHTSGIFSVVWSPDGARLASGSDDSTMRIWDAASGKLLHTLEGHNSYVMSVAWSPNGTRLASGSEDDTVRIWDAGSGELLHTLEEYTDNVDSVVWSPDGARLASGAWDGTVRIWDAGSGELMRTLEGHGGSVDGVAWSPDGARLASGSIFGAVRIWDARSGELVRTLKGHTQKGHTNWVRSVAWSPDGARLASGADNDNAVRIWDAGTGGLLRTLEGHGGSVTSVAWSPDGARLASGSRDETVRIWDAGSAALLRTLKGHTSDVWRVAWSPDGTRLVSVSFDGTMRIWDTGAGELLRILEGSRCVSWSPDGARLASGSGNTVHIWDAESGGLLRTLEGHGDNVDSVSWSPDGSRLASGAWDGTVRVWDVSDLTSASPP